MDEKELYNLYKWKPEMGDYTIENEKGSKKSKIRNLEKDTKKTLIVSFIAVVLFVISFIFFK